MSGAGKAAWRYTAPTALFFCGRFPRNPRQLLSDLDSTVAWAKSQGGDTSRLGIVGFCRGGRNVWEYAAHNSALKAAVAFYGPPVDPPNPLWPKSPTQGTRLSAQSR